MICDVPTEFFERLPKLGKAHSVRRAARKTGLARFQPRLAVVG